MAVETALAPQCRVSTCRRKTPVIRLRQATLADLDAMVDIALTAMPMDPQWNWRFPYQSEYPEDTRLFTRWKYEEFLQDEGNWMVMLAECEFANQPIAMAIWEVSALGYPKLHNCS
jgi:hypothetical protein